MYLFIYYLVASPVRHSQNCHRLPHEPPSPPVPLPHGIRKRASTHAHRVDTAQRVNPLTLNLNILLRLLIIKILLLFVTYYYSSPIV